MMKKMKIFKRISSLLCLIILLIPQTVFASNRAFSVGTNEGMYSIDTSDSATYAANCFATAGYTSNYSIQPTVDILRGTFSDGTRRLESEVLFFAGHANYSNMNWNYLLNDQNPCGIWIGNNGASSSTIYRYAGLNDKNLSNTKIAMFFGCNTGNTSNGTNLVSKAGERGADFAIGWKESVGTVAATKWRKAFVNQLALGDTTLEARNYANSLSYNDNAVTNTYTYGNLGLVIRLAKAMGSVEGDVPALAQKFDMETDLHQEYSIPKDILIDINNIDFSKITDYIKLNVYEVFEISDFDVKVVVHEEEGNSGLIILTLKLDNVCTTTDIRICVTNGKVTKVASNGSFEVDKNMKISKLQMSDEELCNSAKARSLIGYKYDIVNQQVIRKYDIEQMKSYAVVLTHYYDEVTDSYWSSEETFYE